jgi:hypothetical protein
MEASAHARKSAAEGRVEEERKAGRVGEEGKRTRRAARSPIAVWTETSVIVCDASALCCCGGCRRLEYTRAEHITAKRKYL